MLNPYFTSHQSCISTFRLVVRVCFQPRNHLSESCLAQRDPLDCRSLIEGKGSDRVHEHGTAAWGFNHDWERTDVGAAHQLQLNHLINTWQQVRLPNHPGPANGIQMPKISATPEPWMSSNASSLRFPCPSKLCAAARSRILVIAAVRTSLEIMVRSDDGTTGAGPLIGRPS